VPIPEKREDLIAMGYVFDNEANCRGCGAPMEWWITPKGKKMPMSIIPLDAEGKVVPSGSLTPVREYVRHPHWSDCPNAEDFRNKK
jgi:hypothetical protein